MQFTDVIERSNPEYPYYTEGMQLHGELSAPIAKYSHMVLIELGCQAVHQFLIDKGVSNVLARESAFAMAEYINKAFQDELVEYKIAHYFNSDLQDAATRRENLLSIANDVPAVAGDAAGKSLHGSAVLDQGFEFFKELMSTLRGAMKSHLITLLDEPTPAAAARPMPSP